MIKTCELSMRSNIKMFYVRVEEVSDKFIEMCDDVKINLDNIMTKVSIFVMKEEKHDLILECSYERKARLKISYSNDECCETMMFSEDEQQ